MKKLILTNLIALFSLTVVAQTVSVDKATYTKGDDITVTYANGVDALDWVGIYPDTTVDPYYAYSYSWAYTPSPNGGVTLPTTSTYITPGNFVVIYLCCDGYVEMARSSAFTITAVAGIDEQAGSKAIQVYPNPSNGNFTLQLASAGKVEITDVAGRVVYQERVENKTKLSINTELNKGVYLVRLFSEEGNAVKKLIIE